jgi:hypothetical protein
MGREPWAWQQAPSRRPGGKGTPKGASGTGKGKPLKGKPHERYQHERRLERFRVEEGVKRLRKPEDAA